MSVNSYYEQNINKYKINASRKKYILELVPAGAKTILDIGCGQGELAKVLKEGGKEVSGVDISNKALALAGQYLRECYCFNVESDIWPEDLLSNKFDCIIASELIEHLFSPVDFFKKINKIIKPKGVFIITTPNFLFWKNRLRILLGKFEYEESGFYDKGHIHFFTRDTLIKELIKAGFKIDKEFHFYPNLYRRGLIFLGRLFPSFFAYQLIIRVRINTST